MDVLLGIAYVVFAVLIAAVVIYLCVRLFGKFAKFLVIAVLIVLVVWFLFSDHSILGIVRGLSFAAPRAVL